jgi:hypothetical protein
MKRKTSAIVCIVTLCMLVIVASFVKVLLNELDSSLTGKCNPCETASEAEARGTLVCRLSATPGTLNVKGNTVEVQEAWVEEASEVKYSLVWFPYYERRGYRYICIKTNGNMRTFDAIRAWFHLEGGQSFTGWFTPSPIFYVELERFDNSPIIVTLKVDSWENTEQPSIRFTPH